MGFFKDLKVDKGATITKDGKYRYLLWRVWDDTKKIMNCIGLNPSTADATTDDATIKWLIKFANKNGFGGIHIANLFAYRSTDPLKLRVVDDPVGSENNWQIRVMINNDLGPFVAMWGALGRINGRADEVMEILGGKRVWCFGTTKEGFPKHPVRTSYHTATLKVYEGRNSY